MAHPQPVAVILSDLLLHFHSPRKVLNIPAYLFFISLTRQVRHFSVSAHRRFGNILLAVSSSSSPNQLDSCSPSRSYQVQQGKVFTDRWCISAGRFEGCLVDKVLRGCVSRPRHSAQQYQTVIRASEPSPRATELSRSGSSTNLLIVGQDLTKLSSPFHIRKPERHRALHHLS